jgi:TetR/AcrR family tetracycline transcriptional repressor
MPDPGDNPRSRRRGLSREIILDAAMQLAHQEGVAGLSMRRVAAELGVEPMSLYHHVRNKAALLVLMADRSISELPAPDADKAWDIQLIDLLVETYLAGEANPAVFEVLTMLPGSGHEGAAAGLLQHMLGLLNSAGLSDEDRASTYRGLIGLVVGFGAVRLDVPGDEPAGGLRLNLRHLLDGLRIAAGGQD